MGVYYSPLIFVSIHVCSYAYCFSFSWFYPLSNVIKIHVNLITPFLHYYLSLFAHEVKMGKNLEILGEACPLLHLNDLS